jgi:hypothetical protein
MNIDKSQDNTHQFLIFPSDPAEDKCQGSRVFWVSLRNLQLILYYLIEPTACQFTNRRHNFSSTRPFRNPKLAGIAKKKKKAARKGTDSGNSWALLYDTRFNSRDSF